MNFQNVPNQQDVKMSAELNKMDVPRKPTFRWWLRPGWASARSWRWRSPSAAWHCRTRWAGSREYLDWNSWLISSEFKKGCAHLSWPNWSCFLPGELLQWERRTVCFLNERAIERCKDRLKWKSIEKRPHLWQGQCPGQSAGDPSIQVERWPWWGARCYRPGSDRGSASGGKSPTELGSSCWPCSKTRHCCWSTSEQRRLRPRSCGGRPQTPLRSCRCGPTATSRFCRGRFCSKRRLRS